jgi:hypothetical protein
MTSRNWSTGMSVIRPTLENPRAVDDHVDLAGLLEEPFHQIFVGDVDGRGGVGFAHFGGASLCALGVAVGDDHPVSLGGQRLRRRPADPGRCADHDRDPLATVAHPVGLSTTKVNAFQLHILDRSAIGGRGSVTS